MGLEWSLASPEHSKLCYLTILNVKEALTCGELHDSGNFEIFIYLKVLETDRSIKKGAIFFIEVSRIKSNNLVEKLSLEYF